MTTTSLDLKRKRLRFRSWHRGTKEADLVVGGFADDHLAAMSADQLDRFEALLEAPDPDLMDWITGRRPPPADFASDVLALLADHIAARSRS